MRCLWLDGSIIILSTGHRTYSQQLNILTQVSENPYLSKVLFAPATLERTYLMNVYANAKVQFGTPGAPGVTATKAPSKANPKTGDEAPLTAVITLALLAASGILFGVFYKRKED